MKVTKQQKILAGVMLLGGIALACDRLAASAPAAEAGGTSEYAVAASAGANGRAPAIAAHAAQLASAETVSISQRLRDAAACAARDGSSNRDAFALGADWGSAAESPSAPTAAALSRDEFRRIHKLTGALTSGGRVVAMIDGKFIGLGQKIDGFKLTAISHRTVTFEGDGGQVVLSMTERGAGNTTVARAINP